MFLRDDGEASRLRAGGSAFGHFHGRANVGSEVRRGLDDEVENAGEKIG
jgi:hypothetical protein